MNTNNCILKDLSSLITQTTIHYNEDFKWQDVELTSEFKDAYEEYLDRNNWKIEFFNATSVITTSTSKKYICSESMVCYGFICRRCI